MLKWGTHPAVYAVQPVNEPWEHSDLEVLKQFYRTARGLIQSYNPELVFVFHDAFHTSAKVWNDLFADDDCQNVALDTHVYMAWETPKTHIPLFCERIYELLYAEDIKNIKYDMYVGEWSLATDECGMWLDGMNDEQEGFPQFECQYQDCPKSYMPAPLDFDFDRTAEELGPVGENSPNLIKYGQCPYDAGLFSYEQVRELGECTLEIFDHRLKA